MLTSPFARFVIASGMTNLADGIAAVAWAWLATLITRDPLLIALVPVALRIPWFLFAIPAGIITDRVDRRTLILRMDILRALAFGAAAIGIWISLLLADAPTRGVSDPTLFTLITAAAFGVGIAEVFRDNVAQTMIPSIVPHSDLERANGRLWSVELVGNALLGPALGAFLIAAWLPLPFAVNALAFAAAIWLVYRIPGRFTPNNTTKEKNLAQRTGPRIPVLKKPAHAAPVGLNYRWLEPVVSNGDDRPGAACARKPAPGRAVLRVDLGRWGHWWRCWRFF